MSKRRIVGLAVALATVAGLALAFYPLRSPRPEVLKGIPDWCFDLVLVVGLIAVAGAGLSFASLVVYVPVLSKGTPDCRPVRRDELELLHEFSEQHLSVGTFSINDAKRAYNLNRDLFWGVWRERRKWFSLGFTSDVVGFFTIVPMNAQGRRLLASNDFSPALHVSKQFVVSGSKLPAALYIGGVASSIGNKALVVVPQEVVDSGVL